MNQDLITLHQKTLCQLKQINTQREGGGNTTNTTNKNSTTSCFWKNLFLAFINSLLKVKESTNFFEKHEEPTKQKNGTQLEQNKPLKNLLSNFLGKNKYKEGRESSQPTQAFSEGSGDELVSKFVKTSQQLQEMVRSFEGKVNKSTDYIRCLQVYITTLNDQLECKNKQIKQISSRYVSLCKEKQAKEEHLQSKVDELNAAVEAFHHNDATQLKKLLIQQMGHNRLLQAQNENLARHVTKLCRDKLG